MKLLSTLILLLAATASNAGSISAGLRNDASKFLKNLNLENSTRDGKIALEIMSALAERFPDAVLKRSKGSIFFFLPQRGLEKSRVIQGTLDSDGTLKLRSFTTSHETLYERQLATPEGKDTIVHGASSSAEGHLVFSLEEIGNLTFRIKSSEELKGRYGVIRCELPSNEIDRSVILFSGDLKDGNKFKYVLKEDGKVLDIASDVFGEQLIVRVSKDGNFVEKKYINERIESKGKVTYELKLMEESPLTTQRMRELGLIVEEEIIPGLKAAQSTELPKVRKKSP